MEYIVHKRFRGTCLSGIVNIPAGTILSTSGGIICFGEYPICYVSSENAYKHFAVNYDGRGIERGQLTRGIIRTLQNDGTRWNKVWEDSVCKKYKREDHENHWLWNRAFYEATICDLKYIANLIRAKGVNV